MFNDHQIILYLKTEYRFQLDLLIKLFSLICLPKMICIPKIADTHSSILMHLCHKLDKTFAFTTIVRHCKCPNRSATYSFIFLLFTYCSIPSSQYFDFIFINSYITYHLQLVITGTCMYSQLRLGMHT